MSEQIQQLPEQAQERHQVSQEQQDSQEQTQQETGANLQAVSGQEIEGVGDGYFGNFANPKKGRFLAHYINTGGQVGKSARLASIDPQTHYNWLRADPIYKEAFAAAQQRSLDVIEQEIIRRGVKGYKEPLVYQGKLTGQHVRRYSDLLLMFLAKRRDPQYRDNYGSQVGIMASGQVQIMFAAPATPEQAPQLAEKVIDADYQLCAGEQDQDSTGNGGG